MQNGEEVCEWTVEDLVFEVSKDGESNVVTLSTIEDIEAEDGVLGNAVQDGSDQLVALGQLDGSGYTGECRDAFLNGAVCSMTNVVAAKRRFVQSDLIFAGLSVLSTLSFVSVYWHNNQIKKRGTRPVLDTRGKHLVFTGTLFLNLVVA
eukprot:CAMPEP_0177743192 /NCGR_PEP_ID=MMETSP0484_2-20121128/29070_1 /TAXON_ID=354590 /ORGANISM="Rhodomonas lens, Strain RHODO" /LENGTH=148 /DNA_ID=CAMNT_0019257589 /DNA_START=188 /DNA_END=631 /DNA_ORIENTATION=+